MIEVWTPVKLPGAEKWDVSTSGNFRRNAPGRGTYAGRPKMKRIKRDTLGRPFAVVTFPDPSKGRRAGRPRGFRNATYKVGVVILTSFVGPRPSPRHLASHLDDDPLGDRLTNLAWETKSENEKRKKINQLLQAAYAAKGSKRHGREKEAREEARVPQARRRAVG